MKNITCSHPSILVHKKRSLPCVAFSVFGAFFIVGSVFSFDASIVYAATYNFVQSGWSGGLDAGTVATHTLNQSNWGKYSTSTGLTMGSTVQIPLSSYTFTDDGATSTSPTATTFGGGFSNGINTSTIVSGSGVGASVQLPVTGPLTALTPPTVVTGTRPNTIFLSPDGTSAYVMNRSNDTISMFSRNTTTGVLTALATPTIAGGHHTAQGIISPDGNWVYLANAGLSGDYNIRLYSRNTGTGALTYISIQGGTNGSLTMSHDGKSIYTNTYQSTSVSELSRNITTGVLTSVGSTPQGLVTDRI